MLQFLCTAFITGTLLGGGAIVAPTGISAFETARFEVASGVIAEVDVKERVFLFVAADRPISLSYGDDTKFTINGKEAHEDEVMQEGMPVVVTFEKSVASQIDATPSPR